MRPDTASWEPNAHIARPACMSGCGCESSHWRLEGEAPLDRFFWRVGAAGCAHPRHDERRVLYWGISPSPLEGVGGEFSRKKSAGHGWYWSVVWNSEPSTSGWCDSEADALREMEGFLDGFRGVSQRCDLVASDELRNMMELWSRHERRQRELEAWKAVHGEPSKVALCETCAVALRAEYLPAGWRFCGQCKEYAREFLLADPRADRACEVCRKPLPRAAVHATAHFDCRRP